MKTSAIPETPARMPNALRLADAAHALSRVLAFTYPADAVLSRYFRERHVLGPQDRAFVAEARTIVLVIRARRGKGKVAVGRRSQDLREPAEK